MLLVLLLDGTTMGTTTMSVNRKFDLIQILMKYFRCNMIVLYYIYVDENALNFIQYHFLPLSPVPPPSPTATIIGATKYKMTKWIDWT